jgi:hypothetical protein
MEVQTNVTSKGREKENVACLTSLPALPKGFVDILFYMKINTVHWETECNI